MSRFDAAANKAARTAGVTAAPKPKAKVASKAAAVKVAPKSKASAPPPKLTTLEDKKKFVKMWEMKIDDKDCEVQAEANKKAKKDLETALKKLQTDETYLKVKEDAGLGMGKVKDLKGMARTHTEPTQTQAWHVVAMQHDATYLAEEIKEMELQGKREGLSQR
ncbi:unnamed protein product [Durusdinium trenchii]|uniref:Uncharacterized protein n=1 Tax=Durusdinium trenchii TaxID=1381693 RepID=A0ABP0RVT3_9DINO